MIAAPVLHSPSPEAALSASAMPELRRLAVESTDHEVVITGWVSSFYMKQMAQEAIRGAAGPRKLLNRVQVRR